MKDCDELEDREVHIAAKSGSLADLTRIISSNPSELEANGWFGKKPLHYAAESGSLKCVKFLIESGAEVNAKCIINQTSAIFYASTDEIAEYLIEHGAKLDIVSTQGRVPLDYAVQGLHETTIRSLIRNGVNVNYKPETNCFHTLLQWAISATSKSDDSDERARNILEMLLDAGADPNDKNSFGITAINEACRWGLTEIVQVLLENGADPNLADVNQNDAFDNASNYPKILHLLEPYRREKLVFAKPKQSPNQLIERLLAIGIVRNSDLEPTSENEIKVLEKKHQVVLPLSYKLFLRRMGKAAGEFLVSDHWSVFLDDLDKLGCNFDSDYLDSIELPPFSFVFAERLGAIYFYFIADGNSDDPVVYGFGDEGDLGKVYDSFWGFFEERLEYYEFYCDPTRFS